MGDPPSDDGGNHDTAVAPSSAIALTSIGTLGAVTLRFATAVDGSPTANATAATTMTNGARAERGRRRPLRTTLAEPPLARRQSLGERIGEPSISPCPTI